MSILLWIAVVGCVIGALLAMRAERRARAKVPAPPCPTCDGRGHVRSNHGKKIPCRACGGSGQWVSW